MFLWSDFFGNAIRESVDVLDMPAVNIIDVLVVSTRFRYQIPSLRP